jgi:predicted glycosyltransferase
MRILYDVIHPADVHFFRRTIERQRQRGDEIAITSRDKDIALLLLDRLELPHTILTCRGRGLWGLALELVKRDAALLRFARGLKPDILVANNSPCVAHVGRLLRRPSLIFDDTEIHRLNRWLYRGWATEVHVPESYALDCGPRVRRYPSYHALAYLHPAHFMPDRNVLQEIDPSPNHKRVLIRFVDHGSSHDFGHRELSMPERERIVSTLAEQAHVSISSERPLPASLEPYRVRCAPERIHDLLAFSDLVIGESATMCTEAAVLGTPAIYIDSKTRGYTDDLMDRYGLCTRWSPHQLTPMLEHARRILAADEPRKGFRKAWQLMIAEHVDASAYQEAQIDRMVAEHAAKHRARNERTRRCG